jgi:polar amino acid transport system permease protein
MRSIIPWARKQSIDLFQIAGGLAFSLATAILALLREPITWIFDIWFSRKQSELLAEGVFNTVGISVASIVAGTLLGIILAYIARPAFANRKFLSLVSRGVLYVALSVPVYVLLIFGQGWFANPWIAAVVFLSLNLAVFVCRLMVRAFETLPIAQVEAARAAGAHGWSFRWNFELPALWRSCGAGVTNEWATTLKLSSLVGVIGAYDIMKTSRTILDETYDTRVFLVVVAVYALLTIPVFMLSDRYMRQQG